MRASKETRASKAPPGAAIFLGDFLETGDAHSDAPN